MCEDSLNRQKAAYPALLQNLGQATFDEIESVMSQRATVGPETGLTPEVIGSLSKKTGRQQPRA